MKILRALFRIIVGVTFILSGTLKLSDPVGTGLIMDEYLSILHLAFLKDYATLLGIILSTVEFTTGFSMLLGARVKFFSYVALVLIGIFTPLTLYLALYNPIDDCGCFGQAIHLTNWQTFYKNLVLLVCILFIFFQRKRLRSLAPAQVEWGMILLLIIDALWIGSSSLTGLPSNDYTAYAVGTDLNQLAEAQTGPEMTIVYSKDGEERLFDLDNLPDSTWTFVRTETEMPDYIASTAQADLSLRDREGEYHNDMLFSEGPLLAAVVWEPEDMSNRQWERIIRLRNDVRAKGLDICLFSIDDNVPDALSDILYIADRKALLTLLRSNGGTVLFNSGVIVGKWPSRSVDSDSVVSAFESDPDEFILHFRMKLKAFNAANILGTVFLIFLIRYICGLFRRKEDGR